MFVRHDCVCFGWKLEASGCAERIPGSRSTEVLLKHSDLKAPVVKISKTARRDGGPVCARKD